MFTQQASRWNSGVVFSTFSCTQLGTGRRPAWSSANATDAW